MYHAITNTSSGKSGIKYFDRLVAEFAGSPHLVQALFERGQVFVSLGEMDQAAADFERIVKTDPESRFVPYALNHLGTIANGRREYATAADYFAGAAERDAVGELKGEANFQHAQALLASEQYDMAQKEFGQFLTTFPEHKQAATALSQLVICLVRQKLYAEALIKIALFEQRYAASAPRELVAAVQYEKTWVLRGLGKNTDAVSAYRRTIKEAGESVLAAHSLVELAALEGDGGNTLEAVRLLERFEKLSVKGNLQIEDSVKEQSAYLLGVYLFKSDKFEEASRSFQRFIERFAESAQVPPASFFGGECCFQLGQYSRAIAHLTRVVELYPSHELFGPSLLRLSECLAVLQKWARSEQVFEQYASRFPDSELWFQARFGVGWARENQGRHEEALRAYGRIVEKRKGETAARAQFQIGECLFAQEKFEPAVRELLKVEILYGYPEWSAAALYEAGRCLERLGRQEQARIQFAQVTEKYKQTSWSAMASKRLAEL